MEGKGGEVHKKSDFRSSFKNKSWILDHGIRRRSVNKELEFRSWHCGRQAGGSLNKELDFTSWHCGRQGGKFK